MKKTTFSLLSASMLLAGCYALPVSIGGEIGGADTKKISVETESKYNLLGLFPLTADESAVVIPLLLQKCPEGRVEGINTLYIADWALFGSSDRLAVTGFCK